MANKFYEALEKYSSGQIRPIPEEDVLRSSKLDLILRGAYLSKYNEESQPNNIWQSFKQKFNLPEDFWSKLNIVSSYWRNAKTLQEALNSPINWSDLQIDLGSSELKLLKTPPEIQKVSTIASETTPAISTTTRPATIAEKIISGLPSELANKFIYSTWRFVKGLVPDPLLKHITPVPLEELDKFFDEEYNSFVNKIFGLTGETAGFIVGSLATGGLLKAIGVESLISKRFVPFLGRVKWIKGFDNFLVKTPVLKLIRGSVEAEEFWTRFWNNLITFGVFTQADLDLIKTRWQDRLKILASDIAMGFTFARMHELPLAKQILSQGAIFGLIGYLSSPEKTFEKRLEDAFVHALVGAALTSLPVVDLVRLKRNLITAYKEATQSFVKNQGLEQTAELIEKTHKILEGKLEPSRFSVLFEIGQLSTPTFSPFEYLQRDLTRLWKEGYRVDRIYERLSDYKRAFRDLLSGFLKDANVSETKIENGIGIWESDRSLGATKLTFEVKDINTEHNIKALLTELNNKVFNQYSQLVLEPIETYDTFKLDTISKRIEELKRQDTEKIGEFTYWVNLEFPKPIKSRKIINEILDIIQAGERGNIFKGFWMGISDDGKINLTIAKVKNDLPLEEWYQHLQSALNEIIKKYGKRTGKPTETIEVGRATLVGKGAPGDSHISYEAYYNHYHPTRGKIAQIKRAIEDLIKARDRASTELKEKSEILKNKLQQELKAKINALLDSFNFKGEPIVIDQNFVQKYGEDLWETYLKENLNSESVLSPDIIYETFNLDLRKLGAKEIISREEFKNIIEKMSEYVPERDSFYSRFLYYLSQENKISIPELIRNYDLNPEKVEQIFTKVFMLKQSYTLNSVGKTSLTEEERMRINEIASDFSEVIIDGMINYHTQDRRFLAASLVDNPKVFEEIKKEGWLPNVRVLSLAEKQKLADKYVKNKTGNIWKSFDELFEFVRNTEEYKKIHEAIQIFDNYFKKSWKVVDEYIENIKEEEITGLREPPVSDRSINEALQMSKNFEEKPDAFIDISPEALLTADLPKKQKEQIFKSLDVIGNLAKYFGIKLRHHGVPLFSSPRAEGMSLGTRDALIRKTRLTTLIEELIHTIYNSHLFPGEGLDKKIPKEVRDELLNAFENSSKIVPHKDLKAYKTTDEQILEGIPSYWLEYLVYGEKVFNKYPNITQWSKQIFGNDFNVIKIHMDAIRDELGLYVEAINEAKTPEERAKAFNDWMSIYFKKQDLSHLNTLTDSSFISQLKDKSNKLFEKAKNALVSLYRKGINFEGLISDLFPDVTLSSARIPLSEALKYREVFIKSIAAKIEKIGIPLFKNREEIIEFIFNPDINSLREKFPQTFNIAEKIEKIKELSPEERYELSTYVIQKSLIAHKEHNPNYKMPFSLEDLINSTKYTETYNSKIAQLGDEIFRAFGDVMKESGILQFLYPTLDVSKLPKEYWATLMRTMEFYIDDPVLRDSDFGKLYQALGSTRPDFVDPIFSFLMTLNNLPRLLYWRAINDTIASEITSSIGGRYYSPKGELVGQIVKLEPKFSIESFLEKLPKEAREIIEGDIERFGIDVMKEILKNFRPQIIVYKHPETNKTYFIRIMNDDLNKILGLHRELSILENFANVWEKVNFYTQFKKLTSTTLSVPFAVWNVFRDAWKVWFSPGSYLMPGGEFLTGLKSYFFPSSPKERLIKEIWNGISFEFTLSEMSLKAVESLLNKPDSKTGKILLNVKNLTESFGKIAQYSDELTRFGVFRRELIDKELTPENIYKALTVALETTHYWPTKGIRGTIPGDIVNIFDKHNAFFRARLIAFKDDIAITFGFWRGKFEPKLLFRNIARFVGLTAFLTFLYSLFYRDPKYQQLPEYRKAFFINIPVGDRFIPIPAGILPSVFANVLAQRIVDKEHTPSFVYALFGNGMILPEQFTSGGLGNFIPEFIKPLIEIITNYSYFYGGRIESPLYEIGGVPAPFRGREKATKLAVGLSDFLYNNANIQISPIKIDYLLNNYFVSLYQYVSLFSTGLFEITGNNTANLSNEILVRRFIRDYYAPTSWFTIRRFIEITDKYKNFEKTYKKYLETDPQRAEIVYQKYGDRITYYHLYLKPLEKVVNKLIRDYYEVERSNLDPETKRAYLDLIENKFQALVEQIDVFLREAQRLGY